MSQMSQETKQQKPLKRNSETMKCAPVEAFGEIRNVPIVVYQDNQRVDTDEWDAEMWIARPEEWYGLMSKQLRGKRVRVITETWWRESPLTANQLIDSSE